MEYPYRRKVAFKTGIPTVDNIITRATEVLAMREFTKIECDQKEMIKALHEAWETSFMTYETMVNTARRIIPFKLNED